MEGHMDTFHPCYLCQLDVIEMRKRGCCQWLLHSTHISFEVKGRRVSDSNVGGASELIFHTLPERAD